MFGAILGYGGYAQKKWESPKKGEPAVEDYPEFYERLKDIKISIIPQNERGYIPKKIQLFNNLMIVVFHTPNHLEKVPNSVYQ